MKYIVMWVYENIEYCNGSRIPVDLILLCIVYKSKINALVYKAIDKRVVQIPNNDFIILTGKALILQKEKGCNLWAV